MNNSRFSQYISKHHKDDVPPDILFVTIPPVYDFKTTLVPKYDLKNQIDQHPSSGLAFLATQIKLRTNYVPAICYAHQIRLKKRNNKYYYFDVNLLSELCLNSKAKIIGLSLMSPLELEYSKKLIDRIIKISKSFNLEIPVFIAGGAQSTLDRENTSIKLNIHIENVIPGRALTKLLHIMDEVIGGRSNYEFIDYSSLVINDFLHIYNNYQKYNIFPNLNIISSGGNGCINGEICSFCTAYFLGKKIYTSEKNFFDQIDSFKETEVKKILAGDNVIDLSNSAIREIFLRRVKYSYNNSVPIGHFLSRADFISRTPLGYLKELKKLSVDSILLGIESGNKETLLDMNKCPGIIDTNTYLENCKTAVRKLFLAKITPLLSVIIVYPIHGVDGCQADIQTLVFLKELILEIDCQCKVEIHTLFILPGSKIYKKLLRSGADHNKIHRYNLDTTKKSIELNNWINDHCGSEMVKKLASWDGELIDKYLFFIQGRRSALGKIFPVHSQNGPNLERHFESKKDDKFRTES